MSDDGAGEATGGRQPIAVSDISVYICLIDISFRSKSKEQLNERRAGLSIPSRRSHHKPHLLLLFKTSKEAQPLFKPGSPQAIPPRFHFLHRRPHCLEKYLV